MRFYYRYSGTFPAQEEWQMFWIPVHLKEAKHKTSEVETTYTLYIMKKWFIQKSKMVPSAIYIDIARTFTFYRQLADPWIVTTASHLFLFQHVCFPQDLHCKYMTSVFLLHKSYLQKYQARKALWWKNSSAKSTTNKCSVLIKPCNIPWKSKKWSILNDTKSLLNKKLCVSVQILKKWCSRLLHWSFISKSIGSITLYHQPSFCEIQETS